MGLTVKRWDGPVMNVRREAGDPFTVAAWWWDQNDLVRPGQAGVMAPELLGLCLANGVNELYFDAHFDHLPAWGETAEGKAGREQIAEFIGLCTENGIRVSALTGAGDVYANPWMDPERGYPEFMSHIDAVVDFNRRVRPEQRFYGVHYDMEPACGDERPKFMKWMYWMLKALRARCDKEGLELEFDLNAWYNATDMLTDDDGNEINIMETYTTLCDGLAIMSYRQTAEMQFDICRYEFDMAKKNGCRILLGCETGSPEGMVPEERCITVYSIGIAKFYEEQRKLRRMLDESGHDKVGIAVHWTDSWYCMTQEKP